MGKEEIVEKTSEIKNFEIINEDTVVVSACKAENFNQPRSFLKSFNIRTKQEIATEELKSQNYGLAVVEIGQKSALASSHRWVIN